MKIYLVGSITGGRRYEKNLQTIAKVLEELGHEIISPFVVSSKINEDRYPGLSGKELARAHFEEDMDLVLNKADAIIAEVSQPSNGVGIEIGAVTAQKILGKSNKPLLLLADDSTKNNETSSLILGNTQAEFSYYNKTNVSALLKKFLKEPQNRKRGKFIVIYGSNNIGKTTQMRQLIEELRKAGKKVKHIKYPIYDLFPTGPVINYILRSGVKFDEYLLQTLFTQNRIDYEPEIVKVLRRGTWIVAEDYKGTGICWGTANGVSFTKMCKLNKGLLEEDLGILLDGKRFVEAKEKNHHNEDGDKWDTARKIHLRAGEKFGWKKVNSSQSINKVAIDIWKVVQSHL